jgi:hypothetical protein
VRSQVVGQRWSDVLGPAFQADGFEQATHVAGDAAVRFELEEIGPDPKFGYEKSLSRNSPGDWWPHGEVRKGASVIALRLGLASTTVSTGASARR